MEGMTTKSPHFNFLREFWLEHKDDESTPLELVSAASSAWRELTPAEKLFYEEPQYVPAVELMEHVQGRFQNAHRNTRHTLLPRRIQKKRVRNLIQAAAARLCAGVGSVVNQSESEGSTSSPNQTTSVEDTTDDGGVTPPPPSDADSTLNAKTSDDLDKSI